MLTLPNLLIIGGNARHSGKTSIACSVIKKFSGQFPIIGLKLTNIKALEEEYHGDHSSEPDTLWSIHEEFSLKGDKDTMQMLRAGADRVFYIRASENFVESSFSAFLNLIGVSSMIICESRSLRLITKPGLFLLTIRETNPGKEKDISAFVNLADEICKDCNRPGEIDNLVNRIKIESNKWLMS